MTIGRFILLGLSAAVALAALYAFRIARDDGIDSGRPGEQASIQARADAPAGRAAADLATELPAEDAGCLEYAEARRHPALLKETSRLREAGLIADEFETYRGVSHAGLEQLAKSGDDVAMMVLGQRFLLRGIGGDPEAAIEFLRSSAEWRSSHAPLRLHRPDLELSAEWFYRSALHGRIFALRNYGEALQWLHGASDAPLALGWVSRDQWTRMDPIERAKWMPSNVYYEVVFDLAPSLATGVGADVHDLFLLKSEDTVQIRDEIVRDFQSAREQRHLPPLDIPVSDFDLAAFLEAVCEEDRQELLQNDWR